MGRYYWGDIEGKFWFAIQTSQDISNLIDNISYHTEYTWKVCNCSADIHSSLNYCQNCYQNKQQHLDDIIQHEEETDTMYDEENTITYQIEKEKHYSKLVQKMENIRQKLPLKIIAEIDKIEHNKKILNAFEGSFTPVVESLQYIENETLQKYTIPV